MIGVSNSEGHSVGFYSAMDKSGQAWSATPCGVISNTDCLHYIHDAVLSPCGSYIATVAREAHSMTAFKPPGTADASGDSEPLWCFKGPESGLNFPTGIAIHPSGDFIAVANRIRLGISLYRRSGDKGRFEVKPFQFITEQDGYRFDLSSPHGLDFSPDGKFLVVTHKRFRTWGNAGGGQSGLAVYRWQETPDPHLDSVPVAIERYGDAELHSVSVHPSGDLIGVSDEGMGVDIFRFSAQQGSLSKVATFPLFRIGSSVKGLGFTRDGKQFAVTCDLDEILFFDTPAEAAITPTAAVA
jgi:6-phosphogluconolactonase (cycloisomerase 2 family)